MNSTRLYSLLLALGLAIPVPFAVCAMGELCGGSAALAQNAPAPQMPAETDLKQGTPEPLEKTDESDTAGGAQANVLPGLNLNEKDVDAAAGAAIKMPGQDSAGEQADADGGNGNSNDGGSDGTPQVGSSTATSAASASGPLKLSLPTNEYILPANSLLHGRISDAPERSPLLSGSVQTIPDGLKVDLTLQGNLNSETSQKGSEVYARISTDVVGADGNKVYLPGGWVAHGFVTDRSGQLRHGRAGWAEVTFDKIISPDGNYDLPFEAKLSTKDNTVAAVAKIIATDTKYMSIGAAAGSVLSVQMTGIPLAVASHGYSVAIGAGIGAAIGLFGAVRHKGDILSVYPGEHLKLTTAGSIQMPGFNLANLPSAKPKERVIGVFMLVNNARIERDSFNSDKRARVLSVNFTIQNNTKREFLLDNLTVVSELHDVYPRHLRGLGVRYQPLSPTSSQTLTIPFSVDAGKHNYWLLLTDSKGHEVRREPIKLN